MQDTHIKFLFCTHWHLALCSQIMARKLDPSGLGKRNAPNAQHRYHLEEEVVGFTARDKIKASRTWEKVKLCSKVEF